MCYKKPGPRCSPKAKSILAVAKRDFAAVAGDKTKAFAAYEKVKTAQFEYDLTPAGQAEIQAQIVAEKDAVKKYELQQRLEKAVQQRQAALHRAHSKDLGDISHEPPKKQPRPGQPVRRQDATPVLPVDPIENSGHQYDGYIDRYALSVGSLPFDYYTEYDHETNMARVTMQGFHRRVTPDDWFENVYRLNGPAPASFYEEFDGFCFEDHLEGQVSSGYYGDEFDGLQVSEELKRKTEKVFKALPDADDYYKGYEYARQEGVMTAGLTPFEAVKETVKNNPYLKKSSTVNLDSATKISTQVLNMAAVKLDHIDTSETTPYNFYRLKKEQFPKVSAGVVAQNGQGEYVLLGGAERFKAAQDTGRNTWTFHILY